MGSDTGVIDESNPLIILIGDREEKGVTKGHLGINIDDDKTNKESDIVKKLRLQNQNIPTKPLSEDKSK